MMKTNSKLTKIFVVISLILITAVILPVNALADIGPKPSVVLNFVNIPDSECYCTLLSSTKSTGPHSVWDGDEEYAFYPEGQKDIWQAFVDYKDADGFYFLQTFSRVDTTKSYTWGYYPPKIFKVLLYYPASNEFCVSDTLERYAFDSYFSVDAKNGMTAELMPAVKNYDYAGEILSFILRVILTIAIELGVAFIFRIKNKKSIIYILIINCVTQIALNVALSLTIYHNGWLAFLINYISYEFIVFIVEAVAYAVGLTIINKTKPKYILLYVAYALVANLLSFFLGFFIAQIVPGIF